VEGSVLSGGEEETYEAGWVESPEAEPEFQPEYQAEYTASPEEQPPSAGSYTEESAGSYTEAEEVTQEASETYAGHMEQAPSTSGSYTETAEPDFSGEGTPAYSADVEIETSSNEEDSPDHPRSPY
jgi:hypothetical protein